MPDPLDTSGATAHAFVDQVQQRAGLDSYGEAERVTRAALAALADAVSSGQLDALTTALPPELQRELASRTGQAQAFDEHTFLDRVGGQSSARDLAEAERQTRAVLSTLTDWQPRTAIDDTVAQLPAALGDLFSLRT